MRSHERRMVGRVSSRSGQKPRVNRRTWPSRSPVCSGRQASSDLRSLTSIRPRRAKSDPRARQLHGRNASGRSVRGPDDGDGSRCPTGLRSRYAGRRWAVSRRSARMPLSRDRTRCPRCPASRGTTRCSRRHAVVVRVPRRARPVVRIRPRARPGARHPPARCRPARQDAPDS